MVLLEVFAKNTIETMKLINWFKSIPVHMVSLFSKLYFLCVASCTTRPPSNQPCCCSVADTIMIDHLYVEFLSSISPLVNCIER